jgi:hypothetical protein
MIVPTGFAKGLKIIDSTYEVQDTDDHDGYYIVKNVDLTLKADGGRSLSIPGGDIKVLRVRGPLVILYVPDLNDSVLEKLREMKAQALEMGIYDNPLNELAWLQKKKREAREKRRDLATEVISEGLMDVYQTERKKSFSYGGTKPK